MTREPGALSDLDDEAPTLITCAPLEAAPRARDRVSERLARAPGAESHPDDPLVGGVIDGRYKVLDRLGAGGMATVYKAWHLLLEKPVAIKFIRPEACRDEVFRQRFFREARVASQLVHPHAVAMREFGETPEGLFYLVMDLVSGRSLAQVLRQEGRLEPARAARLLGQILGALGEAHRLAIVHRDIKPDNVILTDDERVLVLDFGLAKIVGDPEGPAESRRGPPAAALDPSVTRSGMVLGTPRYMSPEQADGAACDHRTDLYSCGVLLYELLTGRPPFLARDVLGLIAQHLYEEPHPPSEVAPEAALPPALDAVVLRALAKRPDERWPSAQAFSEALDEALAASAPTLLELPILAPARPGPGAQEPGPRLGDGRARLTLAAAALVGMALAGGLAIRGRVGRFEPSSASREVWPEASPTGAPTEAALGSGSAAGAPPLRPTRAELGELAEVLSRSLAGAAAARRYAPELLERAEGLAREASGELASARDAASLAAVRERLRLSESLLGDARRAAAGALDAELRVLRPALERAEREAEAAGAAPGELRPLSAARASLAADLAALDSGRALLRRYTDLGARAQRTTRLAAARDAALAAAAAARERGAPGAALERADALLAEARRREAVAEQDQEDPAASEAARAAWEAARGAYAGAQAPPPPEELPRLRAARARVARAADALEAATRAAQAARWAWRDEEGRGARVDALTGRWTALRAALEALAPAAPAAEQAEASAGAEALAGELQAEAEALDRAREQRLERRQRARREGGAAERWQAYAAAKLAADAGASSALRAALERAAAELAAGAREEQADRPVPARARYAAAIGAYQEAQAAGAELQGARALLGRLAAAIERADLPGVVACYGGTCPDRAFFEHLFQRSKRVWVKGSALALSGRAGQARLSSFAYLDRLRDTRVELPVYRVHLRREAWGWVVGEVEAK